MSQMSYAEHEPVDMREHAGRVALRTFVIGLMAFLTVVDLFAAQAILPSLAKAYQVSPAAMGFAVNACTMGMATAGLAIALFGQRIDRRLGVLASLCVLSVPTGLLAVAPDLSTFTALRIVQGLCMASAFSLTLAHLGEVCSANAAGGAFAAYITGNVASNLIGRLMSAAIADHFGLAANFYAFSALNLAGALLVLFTLRPGMATGHGPQMESAPTRAWIAHLRRGELRAAFAIGFCILFAFIGTFTYVNFVLVRAPLSLSMMAVGLVYVVFVPSIVTTPFAGRAVMRFGVQPTFRAALALAGVGLPLLLVGQIGWLMLGLVLVGIGTFFAQAAATAYVGRAATGDRASASGIYLASYFFGGLVGSAVLGQLFDRLGWAACVVGIAVALVIAALLSLRLSERR